MAQTALKKLSRLSIHIRNLLETGMKITAYNHHARLPSSELHGRLTATSLLGLREPTLSCNQDASPGLSSAVPAGLNSQSLLLTQLRCRRTTRNRLPG